MDVGGPSPILSNGGFPFYLLIVDEFSRYSWFYPLQQKSQVFPTSVQFKIMAENMLSTNIKALQTIRARNLSIVNFIIYFSSGISHRQSCPYMLQQMQSVERKKHLVETGLALLAVSLFPKGHWEEAFQAAVFLIDRLPTKVLNHMSPCEKLTDRLPDHGFLRVFGCSRYPYLWPWTSNKLEHMTTRCVFLGHSPPHCGCVCLNHLTNKTFVSNHITFDEKKFLFTKSSSSSSSMSGTSTSFLLPISSLNIPSLSPPTSSSLHNLSPSQQPSPPPSSLSPSISDPIQPAPHSSHLPLLRLHLLL